MIEKLKKNLHLIILFIYCLTPIIWFLGKGDILITGLDTNFPLNPLVWIQRRFFVWNDVASTGANFASSTAGLFFHSIQTIPYILGIGLKLAEVFSMLFWFSLLVFSAYYFSTKIIPKNKLSQIVLVSFYVFNIYLFNTWENVKVANLAVVASTPLFLGIFLSYIKKEISLNKFIFYTAVSSVIASGSGINPAYFIAIIGAIVLFGLIQTKFKILGLMLGIIFLINSFWIAPTLNQLLFSQNRATAISDIGFTDWLNSLSVNTNLLNVFRLQGAWDWYATDDAGAPLYIPYSTNYFRRFPFVGFSVLITTLAIAGLLIRGSWERKTKIYFLLMMLLGVFLGAGTHEPTGFLYSFLNKHIPFFSFFRSPWYIFTPYVTLAFATLIAYFFTLNKKAVYYLFPVIIVGNLFYNYPLVTGKIFRPERSDSFYVKVPDYIFETERYLEEDNIKGRIVGYPGDEIEQFRWGYRGIESILNLFSSSETIFAGLNATNYFAPRIISRYYESLLKEQKEISESFSGKLNISTIFEKGDQGSIWKSPPSFFEKYEQKKMGEWIFHTLSDETFVPKIYSSKNIYTVNLGNNMEDAFGITEPESLVITTGDTVIEKTPTYKDFSAKIISSDNSQETDYENYQNSSFRQSLTYRTRDPNKVVYSFEIEESGYYKPYLESYRLNNLGFNLQSGINLTFNGYSTSWGIQKYGDYLVFDQIFLQEGRHEIVITLDNKNLLSKEAGNLISLINRNDGEKSKTFVLDPLVSTQPYLIEFDYKNVFGNNYALKIEQKNKSVDYKLISESPQFSPEKTRFSFFFTPVSVSESFLELKPSAFDGKYDPMGTKIEYSDIALYPVVRNKMFFIKESENKLTEPEEIRFEKISPVKYKGEVIDSFGSHILVFSENYSNDWEIKLFNLDGLEITYDPLHFSANLYANVWYIDGLEGDYNFEIYYKPQRIYNIFLTISALSIILSFGYFVYGKYRK